MSNDNPLEITSSNGLASNLIGNNLLNTPNDNPFAGYTGTGLPSDMKAVSTYKPVAYTSPVSAFAPKLPGDTFNNLSEKRAFESGVGSVKDTQVGAFEGENLGSTIGGIAAGLGAVTQLAMLGPQMKAYKQAYKESKFNLERANVAADRSDAKYGNLQTKSVSSGPVQSREESLGVANA